MHKFLLSLLLLVTVCTTYVFAIDQIGGPVPSPGCEIGKGGQEICSKAWDAYDYHHVSTYQSSNPPSMGMTCPIPRIYPRKPEMLRKVVVDFHNNAKNSLDIRVCVIKQNGQEKEHCSEKATLNRTEAVIERVDMQKIFRKEGWGHYMYIKVLEPNDDSGYPTPTSLSDLIGYRVTWLFDGSS